MISRFPCFARILFPAANSDDSIPFCGISLFRNLTEWDCTNEDHCPAICFRVGRMHWQPAKHRNEANCRRPVRPGRSRGVCRYVIWRPSRPKARVRLARPRRAPRKALTSQHRKRGVCGRRRFGRDISIFDSSLPAHAPGRAFMRRGLKSLLTSSSCSMRRQRC